MHKVICLKMLILNILEARLYDVHMLNRRRVDQLNFTLLLSQYSKLTIIRTLYTHAIVPPQQQPSLHHLTYKICKSSKIQNQVTATQLRSNLISRHKTKQATVRVITRYFDRVLLIKEKKKVLGETIIN